MSDVGGCGDGIEEIVRHCLEYSIECQGSQAYEDNPPHGCPGLGLSLGGIADTCQSKNIYFSQSVSPHHREISPRTEVLFPNSRRAAPTFFMTPILGNMNGNNKNRTEPFRD